MATFRARGVDDLGYDMNTIDAIEDYLDELLGSLHGQPSRIRRLVREAETHLYELAEANIRSGMNEEDAAQRAIAAFGSVAAISAAQRNNRSAAHYAEVLRRLALQVTPVVGIGLLTIGLSGLIARLMAAAWGSRFVFADAPGTTYSASDCRYWMSIHPHAATCSAAYLDEATADGLLARYAAGILGVVVLAVVVAYRKRHKLSRPPIAGSALSLATASAFGVAAVGLLALTFEAVRKGSGNGAGQWISAEVVALPTALVFLVLFIRKARAQDTMSHATRRDS